MLAGLLAGYSVAVPVGPVATYLVTLAARKPVRVAAAAALGVATVDGLYAVGALLGGAQLVRPLRPALHVLHWISVAVLLGVAVRAILTGLRPVPAERVSGAQPGCEPGQVRGDRQVRTLSPARAYVRLAGLTVINPTTLICFVALVIGLRAGSTPSPLGEAVFVAAAFAASASWQLALACGGALLGRLITGERGSRLTAIVSGVLIGVLAARLAFA